MNLRLKENISSDYIAAANRMKKKNARRKIIAYVESYDDILFWRTLLGAYENEKRYFEVMLPSHETLERGKRSVLMNLLCCKVGKDMIACVDADYDFLMQGKTEVSRNILENPFVFHTYAYAIENYQCYAPSLHNVCVMVTLNDRAIFNFVRFMQTFSEAIFPLFVWSIWHYRNNLYRQFSITDFNKVVELGRFNMYDPQSTINNLKHKVATRCSLLRHKNPDAKESYMALENELKELGITPETTYLYIQGHHLFDKIIVPIMNMVCGALIRERENEIRRQAVHKIQLRNELSCYSHNVQDIPQMLKKNSGYVVSELFGRLRNDLERFLEVENTLRQSVDCQCRPLQPKAEQKTSNDE